MSKKFIGGIPLPTALEIKAPMNPNTNRIWTEITDLTDSVNGIPDSLLFGGIEIVIEGLRGVYKWNGGDRTLLSSWVNELQEVETRTATLESTTSGLSAGEIYSIPRATYTPSTEPTPTKNGNYRAEAGTYTNWGGTVVPATDGFIYSINVSDVDTTPVYKVDGVDLNIEKATKIASGNTDVATSDAVFNFGLQTAENKNIIPNANFEGIRVSTSPDKTANYYYDVSASKDTNGVTLVEENIPKGFADRALKINLLAGQRISYFSGTNGVNIVLEDGDKYSIGVWLYNEDWSAFDSNTGDIIVHKRFGDSSSQGFSDYYSVGNWRFYYSNNNTYDVTKLGVYVYVTFLNQTNTNNEIFYTAYASIIKGESIFPKFYTNYPKTVELIKDNIDITALNDSLKAKFSADNSVAEELTTLSIANFTLNATSGWDYNTYSKTNFGSHYEIKGQVDFSGSGYNQTRFMINLNGAWSGGNPSASTYESNIEFQKRYYGNTFEVVLNDENTTVGGKEQGRVAISPKVKDIIDFKIEVHQQNVIVFVDGIQVLNGTLTADLTGDFIVYVDSGHGICDISNLKVSATRNFLQKDILQVANISNKFTEIDIDLTSLEDIKKVGGVVTVGTQGTNNSVVKLPIVANENCTIDFDFEFGKDVHSGFGRERILEMAFNSDDFNAIEGGNIGALKLLDNNIVVKDSFEIYVQQEHYDSESAEIHGILKKSKKDSISELDALKQFLVYAKNHILVGHHVMFDVNMINAALKRNGLPKLKNKTLDTESLYIRTLLVSTVVQKKERYSLDDLAKKFSISRKDRHTALGDAFITAIAFLRIVEKLKPKKIKNLLKK